MTEDTGSRLPRIRVTMLGSLPPVKGISDYCLEQAKELSKLVMLDYVSFSKIYPEALYPGGSTTEDDPVFVLEPTPTLTLDRSLVYYNPWTWIRAAMRAQGEVFHVHWWSTVLGPLYLVMLWVIRLRRMPVVITVHNVVSHEQRWYDRVLARWVIGQADRIIVHSDQNRRELIDLYGVDPNRVHVIHYGVYTFYHDAKADGLGKREVLGLEDSDKVVLNLGNIRRYKGIETLLRAFQIVSQRLDSAKLVIAGEPWVDWSTWDTLIDTLGIRDRVVLHLSYVPSSRVRAYFEAADIVVVPYERFHAQSGPGNIALGFGKPLVVSNVGGLPTLVKDARQVVPAGDPQALADALIALLSDEAQLRRAAEDSQDLARIYSWKNASLKLVDVYRELLNRESRADS